MTEPVCMFCGFTDKLRCRNHVQAVECEQYTRYFSRNAKEIAAIRKEYEVKALKREISDLKRELKERKL